MKTFILTISRQFPANHLRCGHDTNFVKKILNNYACNNNGLGNKIHTCRANYKYWERIINEVNAGKAILSLRYWSDKPYKSKQVEIVTFDKGSGIGLQELTFKNNLLYMPFVNNKFVSLAEISKNDGLKVSEFISWFEKYDLSCPMAIIHFTKFRYS